MRVKNASDAIKACLEEREMSQAQLSEMLGENRQNLNNQLRRGGMKMERFIQVTGVLGYQLVLEESE